jgi:hypothetical protein
MLESLKYNIYEFKVDMVISMLWFKLGIAHLAVLLVWTGLISDEVFDGYIDSIVAERKGLQAWKADQWKTLNN